jgi:hypothetical protein
MLRAALAVGMGLTLTTGLLLAQVGTAPVPAAYQTGKIVKVDPATNKVWIRVGTGTAAKEQVFTVSPKTRYFGADNKALTGGLRASTFRPGADIRYRLTTPTGNDISEFRFGPGVPAPGVRGGAGAGVSGGGR